MKKDNLIIICFFSILVIIFSIFIIFKIKNYSEIVIVNENHNLKLPKCTNSTIIYDKGGQDPDVFIKYQYDEKTNLELATKDFKSNDNRELDYYIGRIKISLSSNLKKKFDDNFDLNNEELKKVLFHIRSTSSRLSLVIYNPSSNSLYYISSCT